jgi:2'-5' RNA ligase
MVVKNLLRKFLVEIANRKTEYGCVMVGIDFKDSSFDKIQKLIDSDDLYLDPDDDSFGFEKDPHVTALFGLHQDIEDEEVEEILSNFKKPKIKIKDVSLFEPSDYDVLKFGVESEEMNKLNKQLKKLPHTNSFPDYNPHCTIAYIKKGLGKKYVDKIKGLLDELEFEPKKLVYSKTDDTNKVYEFKS